MIKPARRRIRLARTVILIAAVASLPVAAAAVGIPRILAHNPPQAHDAGQSPGGHGQSDPPSRPQLTAYQKAGRLVCMAVTSQALAVQIARDDGISCFLLKPGGDIVSSQATTAIAAAAPAKPFLAVDEEGGYVSRIDGDRFGSETAKAMGGLSDAAVRALGKMMGHAVRSVGANLDFAPVLDVDDPENQAIGYEERSFSSDPDVIIRKAGAFASGLHDAGVIATYKHFPGLGRATGPTGGNSDTGTATTPDIGALMMLDLKPYGALLPSQGETAVMVGNMVVPGLTGDATASLSPAAYRLLRADYGFGGVAFTDSLTAGSIGVPAPDAVLAALRAGADLPLLSVPDAQTAESIVQSITAAIRSGSLPASTVDAAMYRIERLRAGLPPASADYSSTSDL